MDTLWTAIGHTWLQCGRHGNIQCTIQGDTVILVYRVIYTHRESVTHGWQGVKWFFIALVPRSLMSLLCGVDKYLILSPNNTYRSHYLRDKLPTSDTTYTCIVTYRPSTVSCECITRILITEFHRVSRNYYQWDQPNTRFTHLTHYSRYLWFTCAVDWLYPTWTSIYMVVVCDPSLSPPVNQTSLIGGLCIGHETRHRSMPLIYLWLINSQVRGTGADWSVIVPVLW